MPIDGGTKNCLWRAEQPHRRVDTHQQAYAHGWVTVKVMGRALCSPFVHDRGRRVPRSVHTYGCAHEQRHHVPPDPLRGSFLTIPGGPAAKTTELPFRSGKSKCMLWIKGHSETIKSHLHWFSYKEFSQTSVSHLLSITPQPLCISCCKVPNQLSKARGIQEPCNNST